MSSWSLRIASALALATTASIGFAQKSIGFSDQGNGEIIRPIHTVSIGAATRVDTTRFQPQIVQTWEPQRPEAENPYRPESWKVTTPPNSLPVGGIGAEPRIAKKKKWPAIGATGWVPPDPTLAVGPNNVVVTVNSSLAFFTKAGAKQVEQTFASFFGLASSTFLFDPKVYYDRLANRFILVILEEDDATKVSRLRVAVSDDNDPNGTWFRYSIDVKLTVGADNFWLDYPGFGYNKDAIVFSGNMFNFLSSGSQYAGTQVIVIPKAPLLTGGAATKTTFLDSNAFTYQMAEINDNSVGTLFGVSDFNQTNLKACAILNPTTTPTMSTWFVSIPTKTYPSTAATSRTRALDPSDGRLLCANWRDGHLVTSGTVRTASNSTNRVRWYDLDYTNSPNSAPTLTQSGEVASATTGEHYFMPAINRNAFGDTSVLFTRSSSSITADLMYSLRLSTDPAGTMGAPVVLKTSDGTTYGSAGTNRWGDYFQVNVDPSDDNTFWGVGMVGDAAGNWLTHVYSWAIELPLNTLTAPASVNGGSSGTATVTLAQNARPGGTKVTLSSSDGRLTLPADVTIPSGSNQASFTFNTSNVTSATTVTITAVGGGVTKTSNVTINPGTTTTGAVGLQDYTGSLNGLPATVEIRTAGTNTVLGTYNVTLAANGTFSFTASQNGTFDVTVKVSHWLKAKVSNVTISGSSATISTVSLINGDVNGDNKIDAADQAALTAAFRSKSTSANWNPNADLNGDGQVSASDQAILGKNFNQTGA